ncbi:MAG: tripartite tricarboxylate transporter substrate binding protein [Betaproteobacteria bacterium]|nr:tripartite tricarboxylate transporter substrate binding protein [Betaproteobacteria bacterium]
MTRPGTVFRMAAACVTAACLAQPLLAAKPDPAPSYPNKPVRFIVPFVPGAGTDTTARTIAQKLSEAWPHQVVVDNRTGAAGAIGVDLTAKAIPDGYTICLISASSAVNSATNPKLPYDLVKDLQAITQATSLFYVVYHSPVVPVNSIKELIAHAKANAGRVHFGSSGTGGLQHFAGELFNHMSGAGLVHVPYKGTAAVIPAMLAGDVQVGFGTLFGVRPHMASGRLKVLAMSAAKRSPVIPDVPTVAEAGVSGYEVDQWYGVITSSRVPKPIVQKLNAAIVESLKVPDVAKRLAADGSTPVGSSAEQFGAHVKAEIAKWQKLAQALNLVLH